jgi:hypothetical protein
MEAGQYSAAVAATKEIGVLTHERTISKCVMLRWHVHDFAASIANIAQ